MSTNQDVRDVPARPHPSPRDDTCIQDADVTRNFSSTIKAPEQQSKMPSPDALSSSSSGEYEEQAGLYDFAEELRNENPPVEPWFLESSRLRRIYILWLNKQLALCRKDILERQQPSDQNMEQLGKILHLQGKFSIRCYKTLSF